MAPPPRHRRAPAGAWAGAALLVALAAGACNDADARSPERYCGAVQDHLAAIATPAISTPEDVERTLDAYRAVAAAAPAAVEPEWQRLVEALETADTVVPSDPASVARVNDAALSSQPAATRVQQYTQQVCGTAIGEPPPTTFPVTITTPAPTTTG